VALTYVEMVHPNLPGRTARVPAQSVKHHRRAGWRPKEPNPDPAEPTEAPESPGRFDATEKPPRRRRSKGE